MTDHRHRSTVMPRQAQETDLTLVLYIIVKKLKEKMMCTVIYTCTAHLVNSSCSFCSWSQHCQLPYECDHVTCYSLPPETLNTPPCSLCCSENCKDVCIETQKIHGIKFDTLQWHHAAVQGETWTLVHSYDYSPVVRGFVLKLHSFQEAVNCVHNVCRMGSTQNTAKSLDLMRNLLQKFINREIDMIIQKYIVVFAHVCLFSCSSFLCVCI